MKIKKETIIILICLLIGSIFILLNNNKEKDTIEKFSTAAQKIIIKNNLQKKIVYSKTLEYALEKNNYIKDKIKEYSKIEFKKNDNFLNSVNKLLNLNYNSDEINIIFKNLNEKEINNLKEKNIKEDIFNFINYSYFKNENLSRYLKYKNEKKISSENSIIYVNIGLDKDFYSDINKIKNGNDLLVLCNKYNQLKETFIPEKLKTIDSKYAVKKIELQEKALENFKQLSQDARNLNLVILGSSGYRSYQVQKNLYNYYGNKNGFEKADTFSARPGHSEHQTGLAIDVVNEKRTFDNFENTNEYKWIKNNAHKYGFIIRYPKNKTNITGYKYEPWHLRYVSKEIAEFIYEKNITFDEYIAKYK